MLLNEAGAVVRGAVVGDRPSGTIVNTGSIGSTTFNSGWTLVNQAGGVIGGATLNGVYGYGGDTIANSGSISGSRYGTVLDSYATLMNEAGGTIDGDMGGVLLALAVGATGTVTNAGLIYGGNFAIELRNGGTVVNEAGGMIRGSLIAYGDSGGATTCTLVNQPGGVIAGAVTIEGNIGIITNSGSVGSIYLLGGGTLTNAGTVASDNSLGTAVLFGSAASTLFIDPGAVFIGAVKGNGNNDILVLGSTTSAGTLSGLGSQFTGFTTISVAAGANWTLAGNNAITGAGISLGGNSTFVNTGSLSGALIGTGSGIAATNYGTISAGAGVGISLLLGGSFANLVLPGAGGPVINAGTGVLTAGAYADVRQFGTIVANVGIDLTDGGHVVEGLSYHGGSLTSAVIQATSIGMEATAAAAVLGNDGTVLATGDAGIGVSLAAGGKVANGFSQVPSALISGTRYGVSSDGYRCVVTNYGTITGGTGVVFGANTTFGILTNSGTITGIGGTAVELIHGADTVAVNPGAVFNGKVVGASGYDVLSLMPGTPAASGTLSGLGTQFTGFASVRVNTGSNWTMEGNATGSSTISVSSGAVLDVTGALAVPAVTFLAGGNSVLELGSPASASAVFSGFAATDTIDLLGTVATSLSFDSASYVLAVKGGSGQVLLHLSSAYTRHSFGFGSDGHGGTDITIGGGAGVGGQLRRRHLTPALSTRERERGGGQAAWRAGSGARADQASASKV